MSVFVDTDVFYATFDRSASRHETARTALETVLRSPAFGKVRTSEYVYDEVVTLTMRRTGSTRRAIEVGSRIRSLEDGDTPGGPTILFSDRARFDAAVDTFDRFANHSLSFTDAMTIAIVDEQDIDTVLSFDDAFDGVVDRLDPMGIDEETSFTG